MTYAGCRRWIVLGMAAALGCVAEAAQEGGRTVRNVDRPPTATTNAWYVSNRGPLLPSPFAKLPIGSIEPRGWLRGQLERQADGFIGRLPDISHWCKAEGNAWMSPDGEGHSPWEELPYWLKGFGDLGYVLGDERIVAEARTWIEAALASQEDDGWFGPRENKRNRDLWPNMIMLNVLQSFHEATGDERIVPFMVRYFRWQNSLPIDDLLPGSWQKVRAGDNLESIYWTYNRTAEPFLLELGRKVHERTIPWSEGVANWHGVNIAQSFRQPAVYFVQARKPEFLRAAERNYETVMDLYGQVPGGMFGADENCRPGFDDPRQAAETCSMVEFMHSFEMLTKITGNPEWADRCEDVAFNSLPASMPPDLRGLHYLTAPNMIQLDQENKAPGLQNSGCMLAYTPHSYRCCQHNVSHGWPYYAEELWLATPDNGLCASLYAPCAVKARVGADGATVRIQEQTGYPFDEEIRLKISAEAPIRFPLYLRIPHWCTQARVAVNGADLAIDAAPGNYVRVEQVWNDGDVVTLVLPMAPRVRVWTKNHDAVSVDLGPLTFSLRIDGRWERWGGTDEWPGYEVFPASAWNYGLDINPADPTASLEVVRRPGPVADQPFDHETAPIAIRAKGRRIAEWQRDQLGLVGVLQDSPARTAAAIEEIELIPMGAARLRIAAFPTVSTKPDAVAWTPPPKPVPTEASHSSHGDTALALHDGVEPRSSDDDHVLRFTWWDHKGTTEWVGYVFDEPRRISWSEVYWWDDTGRGGCRVPAQWKLLWNDGETWRPVVTNDEYETARDRYNRIAFEPVNTTGIRIEAKLQDDFSAGILEWRVGNDDD